MIQFAIAVGKPFSRGGSRRQRKGSDTAGI